MMRLIRRWSFSTYPLANHLVVVVDCIVSVFEVVPIGSELCSKVSNSISAF